MIYAQAAGTGALVAVGGTDAAGIGGDENNAGGTVTIYGGSVTTIGEGQGGDIGPGGYGSGGTVTIFGGIFARPLRDEWAVEGYAVGGNPDSATSAEYPYTVIPAAFTVTIGNHPHLIVQRTYSNGSVTSLVTGTSFRLGAEQRGVCVIFTPEYAYRFVEESETGVRPLPSPVIEDCVVEVPAVEEILNEVTFAVGASVTQIGVNVWSGMDNSVAINGTALSAVRYLAPGIGAAQPVGAISGAEFNQVQIVDGKAYLGVSICTNGDVTATTEGWGAAKLDPRAVEQAADGKGLVIPVPATAEKGFMILKSKGK